MSNKERGAETEAVVKDAVDKLYALWVDFLEDDDREELHFAADDVLLEILAQLGANDVVAVYKKMGAYFWYS